MHVKIIDVKYSVDLKMNSAIIATLKYPLGFQFNMQREKIYNGIYIYYIKYITVI